MSGRHPGLFTERDSGLSAVQQLLRRNKIPGRGGCPAADEAGAEHHDLRASIVVGDSKTGETQKYDGPYGALRYLMSWKRRPDVDRGRSPEVPRQLRPAILWSPRCAVSRPAQSRGKVYQLCDPEPPTVAEIYEIFSQATGRSVLQIPTWAPLMKGLLRIPGAAKATHITPESIDY